MTWDMILPLASFVAVLGWLVVEIRRWIARSKLPKDRRPPQPPFPWRRFWGHFALSLLLALLVAGILIAIQGAEGL